MNQRVTAVKTVEIGLMQSFPNVVIFEKKKENKNF